MVAMETTTVMKILISIFGEYSQVTLVTVSVKYAGIQLEPVKLRKRNHNYQNSLRSLL